MKTMKTSVPTKVQLQNTGIVGQHENVVTPNKKNGTDENEGEFFSTSVVMDAENSEWNIIDVNIMEVCSKMGSQK